MSDRFEAALLAHWTDRDAAHDIAHIRRVWANAQAIVTGDALVVDQKVLRAAVVFHDLVNLPKDAPNRAEASALSAKAAEPILRDLGLTRSQRRGASHAILTHSFSAGLTPETEEARVLRDADRLDALGAIGVARMIAVNTALGRALYDPDDPVARNRSLDDRRWGLDHFEAKLFRLEAEMLTRTGQRLAAERTAFMRGYLGQLLSEI